MSAFKLECPSCGLMLTTPNPVPAGTLVNCPKCGTCFGVPAIETKGVAPAVPPVALAQAVAAPLPVAPAVAPAAARAAPPAAAPPAQGDSWFPELDTTAARARPAKARRKEKDAETRGNERPARRGKKRRDNAALIWSLVAVGVVVVGGGAVGLMKFAGGVPEHKRTTPVAGREGHHQAATPERAADGPPEKQAAAAPAPKKDKAAPDKKKVAAKKDKATHAATKKDVMPDDDSDEKPIPGVQIPEPGKKMP